MQRKLSHQQNEPTGVGGSQGFDVKTSQAKSKSIPPSKNNQVNECKRPNLKVAKGTRGTKASRCR